MSDFIGRNKERLKAIISAAVIIAVNVAAIIGVDVGDGEAITNALLIAFDMLAMAWGIWKNHNFTDEAAQAQAYLDTLKAEKRSQR